MFGRRLFLRGSGVVAASVVAGCSTSPWSGDSWWKDASGTLRIATGNVGAVFDEYGTALRVTAERVMPNIDADVLVTGGSVGNVVELIAGNADVGFCLGDTAIQAVDGSGPFASPVPLTALARLYDSFLQVLVRRDSPVESLSQLAGRTISAGQRDSGTLLVTERCVTAAGLNTDDIEFVPLSLADAAVALERGEIDVLAFVSGFPIQTLVDLGRRVPLRGIDIGDLVEPLVASWGPQYVTGPLPGDPYGLTASVRTVSVKTYMVAMPSLAEDTSYGFTSVVFDHQDDIARQVRDVRQPTVAAGMFTQPVPLHPGALRWFRDRDAREVR
ncbi:TAXI family TRAP transporter solute-binding subunit [Rhodococcus sp. MEB064]|uniref:TAXI family TRAP transporter solute-binding subunit n=1 Tax=Rhodococcus sp. MEB064 TaxID=1587522 RepID=UPI000697F2B6|nr:TAXI family TRAP transporter solute-binding subunit [Rhodococcus sp. MEB064]